MTWANKTLKSLIRQLVLSSMNEWEDEIQQHKG